FLTSDQLCWCGMWEPTPLIRKPLLKSWLLLLLVKICLFAVVEGFSRQRVEPNSIYQPTTYNLEAPSHILQRRTTHQNQFHTSDNILESALQQSRDQLRQEEIQTSGHITEVALHDSESLIEDALLALQNNRNPTVRRFPDLSSLPADTLKVFDNSIQLQEVALHNSEHLRDAALHERLKKSAGSTQDDKRKDCKLCTSKGCVTAAADILAKMDSTHDPCQDFYQFACGGYVATTHIPEDVKRVTQFTETRDKLYEQLKKLISQNITSNDTHIDKMVKNMYQSCMNLEEINERGVQPLKSVLRFMGGWPVVEGDSWNKDDFDWIKATHTNRKLGYSVSYLFDFSIDIDLGNNSWRIIGLDQPRNLGIPSRRAAKKEPSLRSLNPNPDRTPSDADSKYSVFNDSQVQAYFKFQVDLAVMLGADRGRAEEELKDSVVFESKLAKMTTPKQNRRNMTSLYNKMTLKELQELVPQVPWLDYINNILEPHLK
ncbi:unnamed protein product, partial [Meganyctiphanes norvegica]